MRTGLGLMNAGETSSYAALSRIAQHAEALGYDSLWVTEREPFPIVAQPKHPVFTGELHVSRKEIGCTLDALAIAAINTDSIRLGINMPNIPFYSPIDVGTSLAALDVLSDGRVQVGLGLGWTVSDFQVVTSALSRPDTPANEFVRVLRSVWDGCEDGFYGDHYMVPRSKRDVTPVQRPYPPIVLTAFAPAAVQTPAILLRGGAPLSAEISRKEMASALQTVANGGPGRPGEVDVVARAVVRLTDEPLGDERPMFSGSLEQLRDDIAFAHLVGVAELAFDLSHLQASVGGDRVLDLMIQLRDMVPTATRMPSEALQRVGAAA